MNYITLFVNFSLIIKEIYVTWGRVDNECEFAAKNEFTWRKNIDTVELSFWTERDFIQHHNNTRETQWRIERDEEISFATESFCNRKL